MIGGLQHGLPHAAVTPLAYEPTSRPSANKVNALRHINHGAAA